MLIKHVKESTGILVILAALLTMMATSCKNDEYDPTKQELAPAFDPAKPVSITDFIPKTGGMGTKLVIYGQNFGNDPSMVTVTISGKIGRAHV